MKDNNISLDGFWGVITRLTNDAKVFLHILDETPEEDEAQRAYWRRMYARAVFTVIDGATYSMMFHAYAASNRPDVVFSVDELMKLEKYYDFDEDQEAVMTFSRTRMLEDIQFAFNAFARVHYSDYILPIHDPQWIHIRETARIREALQFPREEKDLEVYEENLDDLMQGVIWLLDRLGDLLESCREHAQEKFAEWNSDEDEIIM